MTSNVFNYQSDLEQAFDTFLRNTRIAEKTITNYKSDFRHFLGWFMDKFVSTVIKCSSPAETVSLITKDVINTYVSDQTAQQTPASTVNRRLSALRSFFKCAVQSGWIPSSPMDSVQNVTNAQDIPATPETILAAFETYLKEEGAAESTIRSYVSDADVFLKWLNGASS